MRDTATIEEPKFARFLFASTGAAWIWLIARVWLGYQWLHAGWEKIAGYVPASNWDWQWHFTSASWLKSTAGLKGFAGFALTQTKGPHAAVNYGWYQSFLHWLTGGGGWLAPIVAIGETAIGVGLIIGALTGIAAFFGGVLTTSFGLAGVSGVNPLFFVVEVFIVLAYAVIAGGFGRFSWPGTLAVVVVAAAGIAVAWRGPLPGSRREDPLDPAGALAWAFMFLALALWELTNLLLQPSLTTDSRAHPTISVLSDPFLGTHPGRTIGLVAWLGLGRFLVRR